MFDARDLRAIAQLASEATHEVTNIVQGVHSAIGQDPFGITKFVYNRVRGVNRLVGLSLDAVLGQLETLVSPAQDSPERLAVLAALNGVMGDRLFANNNHLAMAMQLHNDNVQNTNATKIIVFLHGLCMNDLQWTTIEEDTQVSYGRTLQLALGYKPIYLRYNTGRSIAENGQEFSRLMENLVRDWPDPIESINIVGYSMGGLVTRLARNVALEQNLQWVQKLNKVVFIGTPHLGAPLEQLGHWVEQMLGRSSYTAPFASLTQLRSHGINDLRAGLTHHVVTELHSHTKFYTIAGSTSAQAEANGLVNATIGDGLVPVASALSNLSIPINQQHIVYQTNHLQLLHSKAVGDQLVKWLQ
jgi:pimeloyl-ACP methyl ester carboxylesterase